MPEGLRQRIIGLMPTATATSAGTAAILGAVAVCTLLEDAVGLGIILPAETVVIGAAVAAANGVVPVWAVFLVAWVCGAAGDTIGFLIGRRWGHRLLERYGAKVHLPPERIDQADTFIQRWGALGVAGGRFIPAVRILVMPVAGAAGMPLGRLVVADVVGVAGWAAVHVTVGYLAGLGFARADAGGIALAIVGLAAIGAALWWLAQRHHRSDRRTTERSMASWLSCSSSDRATPTPTAAVTGRNSVARNVVATATCEVGPVRQMVTSSPGRSDPTAA